MPLIERVVDEAIAALCAEAVGAMSEMHELTVEYLKERKQFGVPIGSFQVLQHAAVDMFVELEQARSMAMYATMMAQRTGCRRRAARRCRRPKCRSVARRRPSARARIQLHGGVGMTMEFKVGHYFKRATMIDTTFGNTDHHWSSLAKLGGLVAA